MMGGALRLVVSLVLARSSSGGSPGPQKQPLEVVIPTTTSQRDIARMELSFGRWNQAEFAPCRGLLSGPPSPFPRECGYEIHGNAPRPELIIFSNKAFAKATQQSLSASLGDAAMCFNNLRFANANLSKADDGYPWGASFMFYAYLLDHALAPYFLYLEPDALPLRARWLEVVHGLVPPQAARFWVKGSAPRGPRALPDWVVRHINGNALYNARDPAFRSFVLETKHREPRIHPKLDSYDLALSAGFYDPHCPTKGRCKPVTGTEWRQAHMHLYTYSDFLVNHYGHSIDVAGAQKTYPCTVLIHGNTTNLNHSVDGISPKKYGRMINAVREAKKARRRKERQIDSAFLGFSVVGCLLYVLLVCFLSRRQSRTNSFNLANQYAIMNTNNKSHL